MSLIAADPHCSFFHQIMIRFLKCKLLSPSSEIVSSCHLLKKRVRLIRAENKRTLLCVRF